MKTETIDIELWAMQLMNPDELDRYGDSLETIEKEQAIQADFAQQARTHNPSKKLTSQERDSFLGSIGRRAAALTVKNEMIQKLVGQVPAWEKLVTMACQTMESLVQEGMTPNKSGGQREFFKLVYHRILRTWGGDIKRDPDFQHVHISEFLERMLVIRLPELAAQYRERGNPILAQVMEELAEDN